MDNPKRSLLERLTAEQQDRLKSLTFSMAHERLCVSFSLDVKDALGSKRSVFVSLTTRCGPAGGYWPQDQMRIVRCLLSKEVVGATYDDAVRRRLMSAAEAKEELMPILASYDVKIEKLLGATDA